MEINNQGSRDTKTPRHVLAAQKAQRVLAELQAAKVRRRAEESQQIEAAKQSAAAELSRARHMERMKFKKREYQIATALGKLVLNSLRIRGLRGVLLDANSIELLWTKEDYADLELFLKSSPLDFCDAIGAESENATKKVESGQSGMVEPSSDNDLSAL
jgi:hypothetical protein